MLVVHMRNKKFGLLGMTYRCLVQEDAAGKLRWTHVVGDELVPPEVGVETPHVRVVYPHKRGPFWGPIDRRVVSAEEAQFLTGLDHPMAALDRLRELVHCPEPLPDVDVPEPAEV